ncbi:hypothetical protein [Arthrobacter sp. TS-15]|uniref:hypothetical protein n=1 Tax=Arthrobacter sp. TS-15 TaxID=2510797 RepID=UPI001EE97DF9|nr:hypothetical protein [Arthrobacter sp. TS-15]
MLNCQAIAELGQFCAQRPGSDDLGALADRALEQERLRFGRDPFVSKRVANGTLRRFRVRRRIIVAMTWNKSAVIGITRSRSVLDGATTSWRSMIA